MFTRDIPSLLVPARHQFAGVRQKHRDARGLPGFGRLRVPGLRNQKRTWLSKVLAPVRVGEKGSKLMANASPGWPQSFARERFFAPEIRTVDHCAADRTWGRAEEAQE